MQNISGEVTCQVRDLMYCRVCDQVDTLISRQMFTRVHIRSEDQVWDQMYNQMWDQVGDELCKP